MSLVQADVEGLHGVSLFFENAARRAVQPLDRQFAPLAGESLQAGLHMWYGAYALPPTERDTRVAGDSDGSSPQLAKPGACASGLALGEAGSQGEGS